MVHSDRPERFYQLYTILAYVNTFHISRYEIGCQLLLITNRKSHTDFRLVPILMILNDLERRNSPSFSFFTEFDSFAGRLCYGG